MRHRWVLGVAVIALGSVSELQAQEVREVRFGDRVRVTLASRIAPSALIGTVTEVGPDTLVVEREEGGSRQLSRAQVGRLEVSVRREYEGGRAALNGFLVMSPLVVLGVIFYVLSPADVSAAAGTLAIVAGLGGAVAGALIGGTTPQDTWVEARWSDHLSPFGPVDSLPSHRSSSDFRVDR